MSLQPHAKSIVQTWYAAWRDLLVALAPLLKAPSASKKEPVADPRVVFKAVIETLCGTSPALEAIDPHAPDAMSHLLAAAFGSDGHAPLHPDADLLRRCMRPAPGGWGFSSGLAWCADILLGLASGQAKGPLRPLVEALDRAQQALADAAIEPGFSDAVVDGLGDLRLQSLDRRELAAWLPWSHGCDLQTLFERLTGPSVAVEARNDAGDVEARAWAVVCPEGLFVDAVEVAPRWVRVVNDGHGGVALSPGCVGLVEGLLAALAQRAVQLGCAALYLGHRACVDVPRFKPAAATAEPAQHGLQPVLAAPGALAGLRHFDGKDPVTCWQIPLPQPQLLPAKA